MKKALFVTKLDPKLPAPELTSWLFKEYTLKSIVATRLKTRHPSYASFHVAASNTEFDTINDTEIWPKNSIMSVFRGWLRNSRKYDELHDKIIDTAYQEEEANYITTTPEPNGSITIIDTLEKDVETTCKTSENKNMAN